jgi:zinc-ribbon domain
MRCPNCGQELRDEDKFCANCGAPAPLESSPDPYGDPYGDSVQQPRPVFTPPSFDIGPVRPPVAAPPRSFVTQAVITLVLYWLLWLPGLIANVIYWQEASRVEQQTGRAPEGKGCLLALFLVYVMLPAVITCLVVAVTISSN